MGRRAGGWYGRTDGRTGRSDGRTDGTGGQADRRADGQLGRQAGFQKKCIIHLIKIEIVYAFLHVLNNFNIRNIGIVPNI